MVKNNYSFSEFGFSSQVIRDLADEKKEVLEFVGDFFSIDAIQKKIDSKIFSIQKRERLFTSLKEQNSGVNLSNKSLANISALKHESTFTITTGHQLNVLSGPLYSIYKIIQVIIWTEELNRKYPSQHFVPVFWMATEDHDFEEINHIHLFNNKMEWLKPDQENYIAGKIETTNLGEFETQILEKFSDAKLRDKVEYFLSFYKSTNLANATRLLMNDLFSEYGLVIIDGNDKRLKQEFLPIIEKELAENVTFNSVKLVNEKLNQAGYHNQVHLRECNLFFIENETTRYRVVSVENGFEINSNFYSREEIIELAKSDPATFSPNALMRPLYQEVVLPNLVYFGGGGEIAYWMQLKDLFRTLDIEFPLLRVRDSYVLLSNKQVDQMNDLGYSVHDLKQNMDHLAKAFTKDNATSDIDMSDEFKLFSDIKLRLTKKVENQDLGIQRFLEGELVKIENQLEKIEKKLIQNEKKNLEQSIKKVKKLKNKIYPNNSFQERYENMLQYISNSDFISDLKKEAEHSVNVQPQIKIFKM